jgi:outer membrane protein TolC
MTRRLIIGLCCFVSIHLQAQHSFSVKEAQDYGIQNNRDIKNASLDVDIASKQMLETISVGLPQINAEAQWQKYIEVPTLLLPTQDPDVLNEMKFGIPHTTSANITASQLIFNGSYIVGLKAAKSFMNFAVLSKNFTTSQIKDSIATAYFNVLLARENRDFLENIVEVHKDIVSEMEALYINGFIEDLEVDRMSLVLSQMKMQHGSMLRRTEVSEIYLKLILGVPINEVLVLTDDLPSLLKTSISFQLEEAIIENRLEYQMAELKVKLKELDLRRYQTDKLPSIAAFAAVGASAMGNDFTAFDKSTNWYPSQLVGIKISLPIFDGLGGMARIQQASLKYEQAKNDRAQIEEQLELAYISSQSNYLNAINDYNHQENCLSLTKKIYDKTLVKYREGLVSSLELSQAGTDYMETSTNFSNSTHNLLISNLNYQRSLGK